MNYLHTDIPEGMSAAEYRRAQADPNRGFVRAILAILAGLFLIFALTAIVATVAHAATPRAVSLSDATVPPTYLAYLYPHASVTYARDFGTGHYREGDNCPHGGYFTDVSAYTWRGGKLGPQRWDRIGVYYWNIGHGRHGRVTFDGITFRNESRYSVLVAGWCES